MLATRRSVCGVGGLRESERNLVPFSFFSPFFLSFHFSFFRACRPNSRHTYGIGAIAGDVPVFFTVVTIFDGSIFTRFGWFRAFAGDVTVGAAVVTHGAVRTVARYVTLVKKGGGRRKERGQH